MYKSQRVLSGGFTIVETLVSVTILLVVIVGPLTIASQGVHNAGFANEQTTAVFLAQEAIEAVQEQRDTVALQEYNDYMQKEAMMNGSSHDGNSNIWYDDLPEDCKNSVGCDLDTSQEGTFSSCDARDGCVIEVGVPPVGEEGEITNLYPLYGNGQGSPTPYTRKITLERIMDGANQVGVFTTVQVSWSTPLFGAKEVVLQSALYDQFQRYE